MISVWSLIVVCAVWSNPQNTGKSQVDLFTTFANLSILPGVIIVSDHFKPCHRNGRNMSSDDAAGMPSDLINGNRGVTGQSNQA